MNSSATKKEGKSPRSVAKALSDFRIIPRIETSPAALAFAQSPLGKIALLGAFGSGFYFFAPNLPIVARVVFLLGLITFLPEFRRFALGLAPIIFLMFENVGHDPLILGLNLAVMAMGMLLFWCARSWPSSLFGRRPVLFLFSGFTALILCASTLTPLGYSYKFVWSLVAVSATYVWFIGYALMDRNVNPGAEAPLEMASLRPLWGSTNTPFPKGAAYLRRIEAHTPEQLAAVQLKGLKLLLWAVLLSLASNLWFRFFHGVLQIPTSAQALAMSVERIPLAWHLRWASQILGFFESILAISILGHRIIACCRMAGFNALRNTYRPLSATTMAEFFNRFYYYFKELLVDFFFYPTFMRYGKGHRRLRLILANFAAACFGNAFYHFTRDWPIIRDKGLGAALMNFQVYVFYTVVLATAIRISQLRRRGAKPSGIIRGQLWPAFCVMSFFCLLEIFGSTQRNYSLAEHLRFLASLFFIHF